MGSDHSYLQMQKQETLKWSPKRGADGNWVGVPCNRVAEGTLFSCHLGAEVVGTEEWEKAGQAAFCVNLPQEHRRGLSCKSLPGWDGNSYLNLCPQPWQGDTSQIPREAFIYPANLPRMPEQGSPFQGPLWGMWITRPLLAATQSSAPCKPCLWGKRKGNHWTGFLLA